MSRPKLLAGVQLLRLPNVFTAIADPLAGWMLTGRGGAILPRVSASACLYTAGIVLNDCLDYQLDCRERPERPLPRGAITLRTAWILGLTCLLAGLLLGGIPAVPLAALIIFYNTVAKHFAWLAALILGACRAYNLGFGMGGFSAHWVGLPFWAPLGLGLYVAGLTLVARGEVVQPSLRRVVKQLLLGIIVLDAGFVVVSGDWVGALLVLSLLVPAAVLGRIIPMT